MTESDITLSACLLPPESTPDKSFWPVEINLSVCAICVFKPVLRILVTGHGTASGEDSHQAGWLFPWLPYGQYRFVVHIPRPKPVGKYAIDISWGTPEWVRSADITLSAERCGPPSTGIEFKPAMRWTMDPSTAQSIQSLPWQSGHENWFFRHFDHAATVIGEQFLANAPQLSGRVLDIGAGDGITDLGLFLRYRPKEFVAVDIVDYILHLPQTATQNGLPLDALPPGFVFVHGSAEMLPYSDEYFDAVISWGSVEHIKGGYRKTLDEVWRVLRPGGLFFVNPGLYYAPLGSHLGEFSSEPHHHLKMGEEDLRRLVLTTEPKRMDRSGFDASSEEYWRFYKELNRIRIAEFEAELKSYGYHFLRAALRTVDMVEYGPALQEYSILDLAVEDAFFTLQKPAESLSSRP